MKVSYSSISTYETCPLQYRFTYIDKKPRTPTPALSFGNSIHRALKWFYDVPTPDSPSKEQLVERLGEEWVAEGYSSEEEELRYYVHATKVLDLYYRHNVKDFHLPVALEYKFGIDLGFCTVTGVIDRLDKHEQGGYEVIDYKTNRRLPPISRLKKDLQLPIYNLAVKEIWGVRPEKSTFYYLIPNQKFSTSYSEERIADSMDRVRSTVKDIEAGKFDPRENALCPWCDHRTICPIFKEKRPPEPPTRSEWPPGLDIAEAVDEYLKTAKKKNDMERRMLSLENLLTGYLKDSGLEELAGEKGTLHLDESGSLEVRHFE